MGGVLTLVAGALTAVYLNVGTIDDGLESLIVLPILALLLGIAGVVGGARARPVAWSLGLSLGMTVFVAALGAIWWIWTLTHLAEPCCGQSSPGFPDATEIVSVTVLAGITTLGTLGALGCVVSLVGWLVGNTFHSRRVRRIPPARPAPPAPPQPTASPPQQ